MQSSLRNVLFTTCTVVFLSSCNVHNKDKSLDTQKGECIRKATTIEKKNQLEQGIRGQVKFLGEAENYSSIADRMSTYNIPALSLAVINNGEIAWTETYKNPNFPEEQLLDCSSIFQAASLSKPVTFMAAVRMETAGKINLDTTIQNYLKDFVIPEGKQTPENPVTFRNIFSHTSGISPGGYMGYPRDTNMPSDLAILRGGEGVNTPAIEVITSPNERLSYSGGGYTLAELALQDIYNDEFSSIMNTWILQPAGMKNSKFTQPLPDSLSYQVAKGYTQTGDVVIGGWRNHPEQAAAGLWSNAKDMAKFLIEIYNAYQGKPSIFSKTEIDTMLSHERDGLVYGFILNRSGDDVAITHFGGNMGYRTGMTISLTSGNGLVYLINSDMGGALGNELLYSSSEIDNWQHFTRTLVQRKQVSTDLLKTLVGAYLWNNQVDLSITFDANDEQISLIFPNGDAYKMVPIEGSQLDFIHPASGVQMSFTPKASVPSFTLYGQTAVKLENKNVSNKK